MSLRGTCMVPEASLATATEWARGFLSAVLTSEYEFDWLDLELDLVSGALRYRFWSGAESQGGYVTSQYMQTAGGYDSIIRDAWQLTALTEEPHERR